MRRNKPILRPKWLFRQLNKIKTSNRILHNYFQRLFLNTKNLYRNSLTTIYKLNTHMNNFKLMKIIRKLINELYII